MNGRIACVALAVAGAATSVFLFAGCGDDTTTPPSADSGPDGSTADSTTETGVDSSSDQTTMGDVTNDQTSADAGSDADAASDGAACTPYDASGLDEASVQAGMLSLWQVYKCQTCHQKASQTVDDAGVGLVLSGNNDGLGDSGLVFPPNLTNDPATGLGCWTDMQVVTAILQGKDNEGKSLCPSMPKWGMLLQLPMDGGPRPGTPMDAGTAQQIVDFLRSLPAVNNKVMETMCPMPAQDGGGDAGDAGDAGSADASDGGSAEAAVDGGDAGDGASE